MRWCGADHRSRLNVTAVVTRQVESCSKDAITFRCLEGASVAMGTLVCGAESAVFCTAVQVFFVQRSLLYLYRIY